MNYVNCMLYISYYYLINLPSSMDYILILTHDFVSKDLLDCKVTFRNGVLIKKITANTINSQNLGYTEVRPAERSET